MAVKFGGANAFRKFRDWCRTSFAAASHTHEVATQSAAGMMSAADKAKLDGEPTVWSGDDASLPEERSATTAYYVFEEV